MLTLEETLKMLAGAPDRRTLEIYIAHAWVRPVRQERGWAFEEIDIARIRLVHHLHEMMQSDDAMDVALHLLDQVYGLHEQLRRLSQAIGRQPEQVRREIIALIGKDGDL
ncbi:MAG: hypothetical protein KGJ06_00720 [Pseudomonadota bacterium]|nr:hypothetical protein [Pseudomonadota bacterium]